MFNLDVSSNVRAKHHCLQKSCNPVLLSHRIHLWYIYLHWTYTWNRCRQIYTIHGSYGFDWYDSCSSFCVWASQNCIDSLLFYRLKSIPSWQLTYPPPSPTFEGDSDFPVPVWWDMLVSWRVMSHPNPLGFHCCWGFAEGPFCWQLLPTTRTEVSELPIWCILKFGIYRYWSKLGEGLGRP